MLLDLPGRVFLAVLLLASSGACSISDWCLDGWTSSDRSSSSYSFCLIRMKVGTRVLCALMEKKLWNRLSKFCFKIFGECFKFWIETYSIKQIWTLEQQRSDRGRQLNHRVTKQMNRMWLWTVKISNLSAVLFAIFSVWHYFWQPLLPCGTFVWCNDGA